MDWPSSEVVSVIYYLLPGFVAAWVFFGLTAHPKASPFERVVQALIFTVIVQALVEVLRWMLCYAGKLVSFGPWSHACALVWSVVLALIVGFVFVCFANKDSFHGLLRKWRVTVRTSFPSEWFSAFSRYKPWVVLHLTGGRRLYGWAEEWPDHPREGYFLIDQPEWLSDKEGKNQEEAPSTSQSGRAEKTLVAAADVEMVEFVRVPTTTPPSKEEVDPCNDS